MTAPSIARRSRSPRTGAERHRKSPFASAALSPAGPRGHTGGVQVSLPARPTVYFTLGTIFNRDLDVVRAVLHGLARAPVNVVATVGPDLEPSVLEPRPANAHVCRYIPQAQVLDRSDLVICHGGAGSNFGALGFGLPLLSLPRGADNFYNADRVVPGGAGRQLLGAEITAQAVAREVALLLEDGPIRAAARQIAAEIAGMPADRSVLGALQALLDRPRPSSPVCLDPHAAGAPS